MELRDAEPISGPENIELAKKCLALIRDIADRGLCSQDAEQIGYALEELSQVLYERTSDDRIFEPIPADHIRGLPLRRILHSAGLAREDRERTAVHP